MLKRWKKTFASMSVGWLLGRRQIQRSNIWITILIVVIMMLTFMSNIVISGILVGLVEGGNRANKDQYTGGVFLSELADENVINSTPQILSILDRLESVDSYTSRFTSGGTIEANYRTRRDFNALPNSVGTILAGIDVEEEEIVTGLSRFVIDGEPLDSGESGQILVGAVLLEQYSDFSDLFEPLRDVEPGTKVKVSVSPEGAIQLSPELSGGDTTGQNTQEFTVKGIVDTKVGEVSQRLFITKSDFIRLTGRKNLYANEIAIKVADGYTDEEVQQILIRNNVERYAKIQTAAEAIPQFLDDIQQTFGTLGALIGLIISSVGAITIFIVIYINAIVRRKQIGILKGIGVDGRAIQFSYIFQALIYAIMGILLASILVFFVLVPFVAANPIDFPFSDGIIALSSGLVIGRLIMVLLISFFAGLIPAWLIVRKNTLDSILGRN